MLVGKGTQGLEDADLEQDLIGKGKRREGGQIRSKDKRTESWGTANETEKEPPRREEEKQESVVSWKPSEDSVSRRME